MKHFSISVKGKVQGVYFRASAKQKADELNICGFAKNEKDSSVYMEAEGEENALKIFIEWCHTGPSQARVAIVNVKEGELKNFCGFDVK